MNIDERIIYLLKCLCTQQIGDDQISRVIGHSVRGLRWNFLMVQANLHRQNLTVVCYSLLPSENSLVYLSNKYSGL